MAAAEVALVPEASGFYAGAGGLSTGRKLVPWSSWAEWSFVRDGLFSPFPAAALRRVTNTLLPIAREAPVPIFQHKGVIFLSVSLIGSDRCVVEQGLRRDPRGRYRSLRQDTAAGSLLPVRCL